MIGVEPSSSRGSVLRIGTTGRGLMMIWLAVVVVMAAASCRPSPSGNGGSACTPGQVSLEPAGKVYFGVSLDRTEDSADGFAKRLGVKPAVELDFVPFPIPDSDWTRLRTFFQQVHEDGAIPLLTLEPHGGLSAVDARSIDAFAEWLSDQNDQGIPAFIRFAHEMNGSWYPWSQQPGEYIRVFRDLAASVHAKAPLTAMMWAPNYGGGYPFAGGAHAIDKNSSDYARLDTDKDGTLSPTDDPYVPYYPGDDSVDWVGMSVYHWGNAYPWGENEVPEENKFVDMITGVYNGANGDDTPLPNFYDEYVKGHGKPLAITETAAFYRPGAGGDDQVAIVLAWWKQVFGEQTRARLPGIGMINWFEWKKHEPEVDATVDWRATTNEPLVKALREELPGYLTYARDLPPCGK